MDPLHILDSMMAGKMDPPKENGTHRPLEFCKEMDHNLFTVLVLVFLISSIQFMVKTKFEMPDGGTCNCSGRRQQIV